MTDAAVTVIGNVLRREGLGYFTLDADTRRYLESTLLAKDHRMVANQDGQLHPQPIEADSQGDAPVDAGGPDA